MTNHLSSLCHSAGRPRGFLALGGRGAGRCPGLSEPPGAHPGRLQSGRRGRPDRAHRGQRPRARFSASNSSSRTSRARGSAIAAEAAARAPKDGYTLLLGSSANVTYQAITPSLTIDMIRDFAPIALISEAPVVLVVHPSTGVKSLQELIALAKAKQGTLLYASSGPGTAPHLAAELFDVRAGVKMIQVPYQGSPQAVTDLIAGRTSVMFSPASTVMPQVEAGKLVALASAAARRPSVAPDLPTMAEAGMPDFETGIWFGLMAPAGTPRDIIDKLALAVPQAMGSSEATAALRTQGFDRLSGGPEEFARLSRHRDCQVERGGQGRGVEEVARREIGETASMIASSRQTPPAAHQGGKPHVVASKAPQLHARRGRRHGAGIARSAVNSRALATARALALGLLFAFPVSDAIDTIAVASLVPVRIADLSFISPAQGQPAAPAKSPSDARDAYDDAANRFKAILSQRRGQIDSNRPLPNLPGQALYLARNDMMSAYKDLTDALASKIGRPNKFGIPPAYFDADNEPLIDEYTNLFKHHAGAARRCAELGHSLQRRRRLGNRYRAGQGSRRRACRSGRSYQLGPLLCRDERQSKHGECTLEHVQGKFADRPFGGSEWSKEMGGDQKVDRSLRSCTGRPRRPGRGAGRQFGSSIQSLDRRERRPDERARRPVPADTGDRESIAKSDRSDEAV